MTNLEKTVATLRTVRNHIEGAATSKAWVANPEPAAPEPQFALMIDQPEFHARCEPPYDHIKKLSPLADSLFYQLERAGFNAKVRPHESESRFAAIVIDNPAYFRAQAAAALHCLNGFLEPLERQLEEKERP